MPTHFTPEALKFLRGLKRHNDRDWFEPRKAIYERELKAPMLALIEEVNQALAAFAPDHVRPPHKSLFRIYRDTRFSSDKRPYKTHIAAWWVHAGMEKTSGAGFYFSISSTETVIAAGAYMPTPEQLLAIRRYLLDHHAELRSLLAGRRLRAAMSEVEGNRLTRPPRGFSADSPAIDLLLCRQWGVSATLPADSTTQPTLLRDITSRFALAAPIVHLLNRAISSAKPANTTKIPVFVP
ncbi:MAG TPA: DUF2461 domain-containing protein [Acidobacteriaceae bacterium]|jgi:uncharacterized protein (TIGR02453 family)|nr:DUF2461 domain-containing protein [Acidobacteriaceae bacterium]